MDDPNNDARAGADDAGEMSQEELDQVAGGFGDSPGLNGGDMVSKLGRRIIGSGGPKP